MPSQKNAEIPKTYEPQKVEDKLYKKWESLGLFKPKSRRPVPRSLGEAGSAAKADEEKLASPKYDEGEPFSIAMPPPNATGTLHLGHAVMMAVEDIMARFARMQGRPTLWLPGTDHASIATENKVEKLLLSEKKKTKQEIGRDDFIKEVETFVKDSRGTIKNQIRKMGASCDWSRERYTFDKGMQRAVQEVFISMYNDGLIYKGHRIVNWCPRCQSTLADDEVEYKEKKSKFYYLKYGPIVIGTARPETKVLDKIIIIHPKDKRYKKYIGAEFEVDWIDGKVKARVVADEAADMEQGSGAMTITPAHSFVDFELAQKHNFEVVQIIGADGKLTKNGGKFSGMDVVKARQEIIKELDKKGLVEKIDDNYVHNLSVCYRCDTPIEPLVSDQWFVAVDKPIIGNRHAYSLRTKAKSSLKDIAIDVVKSGKIKILPERFEKTYFHWMENLHDWCISRQIWFGHRIPVWYCVGDDKHQCKLECKNPIVNVKEPKKCPYCGSKILKQDPDTLDTWFSSALWTFATIMDEPKENDDLESWIKRNKTKKSDLNLFHPTSVMETGYDILFFWVARMILMTTYTLGEVPFKTVYLHGLVRDKEGRKMSKSLNNGIDPLDMISKYGADATRLSLVIGTTAGNDTRLYEEKIAGYRNFVNKIWNISRFILLNGKNNLSSPAQAASLGLPRNDKKELTLADKWIQIRLNKLIKSVTNHLEKYEFSPAGEKIYDFLWHELADWYVEISKQQSHTLAPQILLDAIKLLHPFTPFVTEEIFQRLKKSGLIDIKDEWLMNSSWPLPRRQTEASTKIENDFATLQMLITQLRDTRAKYNLPYSEKLDAAISTKKHKDLFQEQELAVEQLTKIRIQVLPSQPTEPDQYLRAHASDFDIYLKLGAKQMREQEVKISKEKEELKKYISSLEKKLANKNFTKNAPTNVIDAEKEKLQEAKNKIKKL